MTRLEVSKMTPGYWSRCGQGHQLCISAISLACCCSSRLSPLNTPSRSTRCGEVSNHLMRGRLHRLPDWHTLGLASRREQCRVHTWHSTSDLQVRGVHAAALLLQRKPGRCLRTPSTKSTTTMPAASASRSCTGKQLCSCCQTSRHMPDLLNGFLIKTLSVQECVQYGHQQVWRSVV
jgi:hypothetical protein